MALSDVISSSSAQFETTSGFSLSSVVDFATSQVLFLIGLGLAVLQALLPLIGILVAIGAIIGVIYAAWRFFHH